MTLNKDSFSSLKISLNAQVLEAISQAVIVTDLEGTIRYWNQHAEYLYGWSVDEVLGKNIVDVTPQDISKKEAQEIMASLKNGQEWQGSFQVQRKDGSRFLVDVTDSPLLNDAGELIGIIGVSEDISEAKEVQEALMQSENKFRRLYNSMAQGVVYQNANGEIVSANNAALEILGLTLEQLKGKTSQDPRWQAVNEKKEPLEGEKHPAMRALHTGERIEDEIMGIYRPDEKAYRWIKITAQPETRMGEDTPFQVFTTFADITGEIQLQEQLEAYNHAVEHEAARQEAILSNIGDVLVVVDDKATIKMVNQAFLDMFGFERSDVIDKKVSILQPKTEDRTSEELIGEVSKRVFVEREKYSSSPTEDHFMRTKGGNDIAVHMMIAPIVHNDNIIGAVGTFNDMREQKKLDKMKSDFVSVVSHELRTPMTAIKGFTSMILDEDYGPVNEELIPPLKDIKEATDRLIDLVNDMLNLARIEEGRLKYTLKDGPISEQVRNAVDLLSPLADEKGLNLHIPLVSNESVQADPDKVDLILHNLLGNALKFTDEGEVRVSMEPKDQHLILWITDTGIGIDLSMQERVFDKFEQVGSKQRGRPSGTGLGLAISKMIAQDMGGDIWLEHSQPGEGSTFAISLPLSGTEAAQATKTTIDTEAEKHDKQKGLSGL